MSFKIYQIHEHSGEWEDYRDFIRGSYLSKEKAEAEKEKLEEEETKKRKCNNCPLYFCETDCDLGCECNTEKCNEHKVNQVKKHCDRFEPYTYKYDDESEDELGCKNYHYKMYDCRYEIEEVEVIE